MAAGASDGPGKSTSTITWIGYDAPQNVLTDSPSPIYAMDAAPKLNNFLDGLQTAQGGDAASHTTVIAHGARIEVTVVSGCFRAPKGTDLDKEY
ncbi:alpha/beta hydrolase [Streptomyces spiralis]|uniref:alpha/beta hydrolase n=1 Tax=Streptomyces spiralis TaxID=66376 RepID=UPI00340ED713